MRICITGRVDFLSRPTKADDDDDENSVEKLGKQGHLLSPAAIASRRRHDELP